MRRGACLALALCMLAAMAAGCSRPGGVAAGFTGVPDEAGASPGGVARDSVTLSVTAEPRSFDPMKTDQEAARTITLQMYDALFRQTNGHEVENLLARSCTVSEDGLVYTIEIVRGARFHNGDEIKAGDVAFSIDYAAGYAPGRKSTAAIEGVTVTGEYTLEIRTAAPTATLPYDLCRIAILSEKAFAGGETDIPVGSGPYRLVRYLPGVQVELTRFEEYYRGPAAIKNLTYRIITKEEEAAAALRDGLVDGGSFSPAVYDQVVSDPNLVIYEYPGESIRYVTVNHQAPPFDNRLVRQALNYAVDRERILESGGQSLTAAVTAMLPGSSIADPYPYNPELARALLAQAGITTPMDLGTVKYTGEYAEAVRVLEECLADIGLRVTPERVAPSRLHREVERGDYSVALISGKVSNVNELFALYTSDEIGGLNSARYANAAVDDLIARAREVFDRDSRLYVYEKILGILSEEAVYIPLYVTLSRYAHNKDLHMEINRAGCDSVYEMYWD